jgi:hypothetical protein
MVFFLRDNNNNTIIETECWVDSRDDKSEFIELRSSVNLMNYSLHLLSLKDGQHARFVALVSDIDELSDWMWGKYFSDKKNDGSHMDEVLKKVRTLYTLASELIDLKLVTD